MLSQKELQSAIYECVDSLTDEDIFLSKSYEHRLTEMGNGITKCTKKGSTYMIKDENTLAFTDGEKTFISYNSREASKLNRLDKHHYFVGLNLHENGHKLFTDFKLHNEALERIGRKTLYPMPTSNKYKLETLEFLEDENTNLEKVKSIYHNLWNIIEDGFIDRVSSLEAPGYAPMLSFVNEVDAIGDIVPFDELIKRSRSMTLAFSHMILIYCVHGVNICKNLKVSKEHKELVDSFNLVLPILCNALYEARPKERMRLINEVFCYLIHLLLFEEKAQAEGGKSNQESLRKSIVDNVDKNMKTSERSNHTKSSSPDEKAIETVKDKLREMMLEDEKEGTSIIDIKSEDSGELDSITKEVAKDKLLVKQENDILDGLKVDSNDIANGLTIHKDVRAIIMRKEPSDAAYKKYDKYHYELDDIVRKLTRVYEKELANKTLGDTCHGLYYGKRLDTPRLYSSDKRIFSNKILPESIPDMKIGILVDCSGSMTCGGKTSKMLTAVKCSYITYSFCRKLNIPCFIIGHSTIDNDVALYSVADENSLDDKDKYRIFNLTADYENRDGFALRYCLKKLEKSDSDIKLMLVISDGVPSHGSYSIKEGRIDCQDAVHDAIKKGIITIVAGIGEDADAVKKIYKEGRKERDSAKFLDITDLSKMPTAFVKIIKNVLDA